MAIIVMLLIPSEPTYRQLAAIDPGMTIEQVKQRFGEPTDCWKDNIVAISTGHSIRSYYKEGQFWKPAISATINSIVGISFNKNPLIWIGQTHLLWVEHDNDVVTKTWLFPITRTGGGIQGCIDTIKDYWNNWRK